MIYMITGKLLRTPKAKSALGIVLPLNIIGGMTSTVGFLLRLIVVLVATITISVIPSGALGVLSLLVPILGSVFTVILEIVLFVLFSPVTHDLSDSRTMLLYPVARNTLSLFRIAFCPGVHLLNNLVMVFLFPLCTFLKNAFSVFQKVLASLVFSTGLALWMEAITFGFVAVKVIGRGRVFLVAGRAMFKRLIHISTSLCFSLLRREQAVARNCFSGATLAHTEYYTIKAPLFQGEI